MLGSLVQKQLALRPVDDEKEREAYVTMTNHERERRDACVTSWQPCDVVCGVGYGSQCLDAVSRDYSAFSVQNHRMHFENNFRRRKMIGILLVHTTQNEHHSQRMEHLDVGDWFGVERDGVHPRRSGDVVGVDVRVLCCECEQNDMTIVFGR